MIFFITKYELLRHSRDGQSRLLVIIMIFLLFASIVLSVRDYLSLKEQYWENLTQSRLNWEQQTEKDPHDAAHDGTYVIKPHYPLAMLDKGIQPYTGQVIHLGAHERKQSSLYHSKDYSGLFRFGEFTPVFVLLYLFPLFLIFLGYNTFTIERERQTLRLILAQKISTIQVVLGKWLALLILTTLLWILFGLGVLIAYSVIGLDTRIGFFEWATFFVSYLIYFIVIVNLIVLLSAYSSSSGKSLVTLLACWIVFTLIIPKLTTNIAGELYPFPTLQTFKNKIYQDQKNGLNGHNFWNEAAQDFKQKVLQEYGVETIEELPVYYGGLLLAEGEKYESAVYTKHFNLLQIQYRKQRAVYRTCSLFSPFLSVRFVSMALARADYNFQWHFEEKAEQYRVVLNTALNMDMAEHAKGVENYKANTDLWSNSPRFTYQWQETKQVATDNIYEYINMISWSILSFLVMVFLSRKIKAI